MVYLLPIACATCLADPNSLQASAQNWAIIVMLGILAMMFSILFFVIYSFCRRQRRLTAEVPLT